MLEYIEAIQQLSSVLSVQRLNNRRRRRIARALVELHEAVVVALSDARFMLKLKPDEFGVVRVGISVLEKQVGTLAEIRRLMSSDPIRSILQIKWRPWARFNVLSEGKGNILTLTLADFYHLRPTELAEAEVDRYALKILRTSNPEMEESGFYEDGPKPSLLSALRDVDDDEDVILFATPKHRREARETVAELTKLNENLRMLIAREFKPEELA
jgi:hypothetical protein